MNLTAHPGVPDVFDVVTDGANSSVAGLPQRNGQDQSGAHAKATNGWKPLAKYPPLQGPLWSERVDHRFIQMIPRDFARRHLLISQGSNGNGSSRFAIAESTNPAALHNAGVFLQVQIEPAIADGEAIARLIDDVYAFTDDRNGLAG